MSSWKGSTCKFQDVPPEAVCGGDQPLAVNERGAAAVKFLVLEASNPRPFPSPSCYSTHNPLSAQGRTSPTVCRRKCDSKNSFLPAQQTHSFMDSTLLQFCSSALLGQSGTPSHSGLTFLMQEVALHWKYPVQFITGRQDVVTMQSHELHDLDTTNLLSVRCYRVATEQPPRCWLWVRVEAEGRSFLLSGEAAQRRRTQSTHGLSRDRYGSESNCEAW